MVADCTRFDFEYEATASAKERSDQIWHILKDLRCSLRATIEGEGEQELDASRPVQFRLYQVSAARHNLEMSVPLKKQTN
jgi:hypothetical protein